MFRQTQGDLYDLNETKAVNLVDSAPEIIVQNNNELEIETEKVIRTIRICHLHIEDIELTKFAMEEAVTAWNKIRALRF